MNDRIIDFSPGDHGCGILGTTREGLTQKGVAEAVIEDLEKRVPDELRRHLDTGPRLGRLAFLSNPYTISEDLAEALRQVNPDMLARFNAKSDRWLASRGIRRG